MNAEQKQEKSELQGTLYPFRKAWMKPVRISAGGAALALLVVLVVLMMLMPRLEERFEIRLEFGMIAGIFLSFLPLLWITLTITRYCNVFQILYVRAAGQLWRVNLMKLCRVGDWEALPPARRTVVRDDELWEDWYLLREIAGVEERMDEEYLPLLKELEGITGLTIPVLEQLGDS